ncbi:MAG: GNAT family N-acetyltransferase [Actinomycetota bacterium]|nr:GNAT family N-acetyltransferase [Actinomycetota bacterium]
MTPLITCSAIVAADPAIATATSDTPTTGVAHRGALGLEPLVATRAGPVWLRPTTPGDEDLVAGLVERLDPESRRRRFFSPLPVVRPSLVSQLCDVDQCRRVSWVAHDGGRAVAEALGVRRADDPATADLAVMVADDRRRQGIGRAVIAAVVLVLDTLGVATLTCDILSDNRASVDLFESFGLRLRPDAESLAGSGAMGDARRVALGAGLDTGALLSLAAATSACREPHGCTAPAVARIIGGHGGHIRAA